MKIRDFIKIIGCTAMIMAAALVSGCDDDLFREPDNRSFSTTLTDVTEDGIEISGKEFKVETTEQTQWRIIVSDAPWFKITTADDTTDKDATVEDKGSLTLTYYMEENANLTPRSGKLIVEAYINGEPYFSQEIKVTQRAQLPYIEIKAESSDPLTDLDQFGVMGVKVFVNSNIEWEAVAYDGESGTTPATWITFTTASGEKRGYTVFDVSNNTVEAVRKARICIFSQEHDITKEITLSQEAMTLSHVSDLEIVAAGMTDIIPTGTGTVTLEPQPIGAPVNVAADVTVDATGTTFKLKSSIVAQKYIMTKYSDGSTEYALGTSLTVRADDTKINTQNWDGVLKQFGGEADSPLRVSTAAQLKAIADAVNSGKATYQGLYLKLTDDITMPATPSWVGIGAPGNPFKGNFDGDNKAIIGLRIYGLGKACQGLFGVVQGTSDTQRASVTNLRLVSTATGTNFDVMVNPGAVCCGSLIGSALNFVTVENCTSNLRAKLGPYGGGIVGAMGVTADNGGNPGFPALPGGQPLKTYIINCHNTGNIDYHGTTTLTYNLGGITGVNMGVVNRCSNRGDLTSVTATMFPRVGGIVGDNLGDVTECFNAGTLSGSNNSGGIAGFGAGNCAQYIANCYNVGRMAQANNTVGGIIGGIVNNANCVLVIENCYNTGALSADAGAIIGTCLANGKVTLKFCVSDSSKPFGNVTNTLDNGSSGLTMADRAATKSIEDMRRSATFTTGVWGSAAPNWDFSKIWTINENSSTPYLCNNPQSPAPGN